ncbi:MAG: hypothetical protein A2X39_04930 [Elusimicrobia bacterium GWC2_56_31]|nr:MAG: hypothetical protein A2X39_04930 [Elusimicrobia bacterium GWC2_56_31]HBB67676.1 hypothetical protein [Elusimicrobiota bacterium]HBW22858.1 hypothetical protein [Elusimicrobiota bacterium]
MKVLLINPPTPSMIPNRDYYLPLSLLYLASALQNAGVDVNVLDLNVFRPEQHGDPTRFCETIIAEKVSDYKPSLIGLGCLFSGQFKSIQSFSENIRRTFADIPIVIGGLHPSIYAAEILTNCPYIDWVVVGEGEESTVELVNTLKSGRRDLDKIDGFAYRTDGKVVVNPKKRFIPDPDKIAFPAYGLLNLSDYYRDTSDWNNPKGLSLKMSVPIVSSRSCPMRCNFCPAFMVMGPKWRSRSAKNVVDELEYLHKEYGQNHFSFMDDNLTFDRTRMLDICDEIAKRKLKIQFETPNGIAVGTIDEEVLSLLMDAGMTRISLAIESGSDMIRNQVMGKRLSREKILEVIGLTKKYKELYVIAFFVIGMPEDTLATLEETYQMVKDIDVNKPIISNAMPFPGTKLYAQALRDSLFLDELDLNSLWKTTDIYSGANNKRFFLKPYGLELSELQKFRGRIDTLVDEIIRVKSLSFKK